ncbi:DUF421 domain-containing protein [Ammoniphilus resinae]|uniref:Uncharacterized membrane protein YcaP (DUF421 family) n=1 Tax=Ammoniphilus resinae TaxID=861532 RepID=A0ABS4GRT2_9BACL|nr:uncharacterized membrane protein YcaP (DUF421 family) [Ammoniphilus resinae]
MPDWITIIVRSLLMYCIVVFLLRVVGRKQTSQMTFSDFVVGIAIGAIVALISLGIIDNLAYGLIGLAVWLLFPVLTNYLALKSKAFHDLLYGRQTVLIQQGKVMEDNVKQMKMTGEELLAQLRRKNVFNIADVEFALMEASGDVSVLLKPEKTPITPKQMEWQVAQAANPQTVILDGNIIDESLRNQGLTRNWLSTELEKAGVTVENVFIGQVDASGDLYLDLFDDAIQLPKPTTKALLYATLKKCEADLESYALATKDQIARKNYQEAADQLLQLLEELRPILKR